MKEKILYKGRQVEIEEFFYIHYECKFCGKEINEHLLERHQNECKE